MYGSFLSFVHSRIVMTFSATSIHSNNIFMLKTTAKKHIKTVITPEVVIIPSTNSLKVTATCKRYAKNEAIYTFVIRKPIKIFLLNGNEWVDWFRLMPKMAQFVRMVWNSFILIEIFSTNKKKKKNGCFLFYEMRNIYSNCSLSLKFWFFFFSTTENSGPPPWN